MLVLFMFCIYIRLEGLTYKCSCVYFLVEGDMSGVWAIVSSLPLSLTSGCLGSFKIECYSFVSLFKHSAYV